MAIGLCSGGLRYLGKLIFVFFVFPAFFVFFVAFLAFVVFAADKSCDISAADDVDGDHVPIFGAFYPASLNTLI